MRRAEQLLQVAWDPRLESPIHSSRLLDHPQRSCDQRVNASPAVKTGKPQNTLGRTKASEEWLANRKLQAATGYPHRKGVCSGCRRWSRAGWAASDRTSAGTVVTRQRPPSRGRVEAGSQTAGEMGATTSNQAPAPGVGTAPRQPGLLNST